MIKIPDGKRYFTHLRGTVHIFVFSFSIYFDLNEGHMFVRSAVFHTLGQKIVKLKLISHIVEANSSLFKTFKIQTKSVSGWT